jgi:N-methylhydantoinase A
VTRVAEMRYIGQTYEVDVPVHQGSLDETTIDELVTRFQQRHEQEYGIASEEFPITFVNLRVTGKTETGDGTFQSPTPETASADDTETRDVYFDGEWHDTAILRQAELEPGMDIQSPAIVTGAHSTVALPPGMSASVDSHGNITITTSDRRNL